MKQIEWFDQHYYKVLIGSKIEFFPSVTTILSAAPKPFLAEWRGNVGNDAANRIMTEAMERGSRIHHACEYMIKGHVIYFDNMKDSMSENELSNLKKYRKVLTVYNQTEFHQIYKFQQLLEALNPVNVISESIVYNIDDKYAGTMDLVLQIDEGDYNIAGAKPIHLEAGTYIADIKTGSSIPDEYWMQIGAYGIAAIYNGLITLENYRGGMIIHTNAATRTGIEGLNVKVKSNIELQNEYKKFLKVYEVWKLSPTANAPKIFEMPQLLTWELNHKSNNNITENYDVIHGN